MNKFKSSSLALRFIALCLMLFFMYGAGNNALGQRPPNENKYLGKQVEKIEIFDASGKHFNISEFFGDMPVLLSPVYTRCPSSCSIITANLKEAVNKAGGLGENYKVLTFSFDWDDNPEDLETFINRWKLDDDLWKVVGADKENIEKLLASIDFDIVKDTVMGDYLHPNVVIVVSPQMKISRFVYGVFPTSRDINMAVLEAKQEKTSLSFYEGFVLSCFRFDDQAKTYMIDWPFIIQIFAGFSFISILIFIVVKDSFFRDMDVAE